MRSTVFFLLFFCLLLICLSTGCQQNITKEEATIEAISFLQQHVKFFPKDQDKEANIDALIEVSPDSYEEDDRFVIIMKARASQANQSLKNDLVVEVSKKTGKVMRFNGQDVPQ